MVAREHLASPTMGYVRVGLGILLVCVVPGVLVVLVARVRLSVIETLAVVPACSLGVVFVLAEVTTLLRIPFGPPAFFAMIFVLGIVVVIACARVGQDFVPDAPPSDYDGDRPPSNEADGAAPWF